jgi:hypothetical protein
MTLSFGPTTNLAVQDTAQLGPNAATVISTATAVSTTLSNGVISGIAPQVVGPFFDATTIVVTATGDYQFVTGANADGLSLSVGISSFSHGGPFFNQVRHDPLITSQPASQTTQGAFAVEHTFTLAGSTSDTFNLSAIPTISQPATSTIKILNAYVKVEAMRR